MTTPNIPDLPYTLGVSTGGAEVPLQVVRVLERTSVASAGDVLISSNADDDRDPGIGWYNPADLIRELSRFVPIPAEARKLFENAMIRHQRIPKYDRAHTNRCSGCDHLDGETDGANSPRHVKHQVEVGFAALAAAGLLVGPGEPAASEGEPVAWRDGDVFRFDSPRKAVMFGMTPLHAHPPVTAEPAPDAATLVDEWLEEPSVTGRSLLDRLAAHGLTVTAEPATAPSATAPSVEQIAEVLIREYGNLVEGVVDAIRALWSPAPGDAAEVNSIAWWRQQCNGQESRAIEAEERAAEAEARVRELEPEYDEASEMRINLANRVTEVENIARAQVRELGATLYANGDEIVKLQELVTALESHHLTYVAYTSEKDRLGKNLAQASRRLDRARAAVEAETTEGARDE